RALPRRGCRGRAPGPRIHRRGDARIATVPGRPAGAGPVHPHRRGHAHQQLPAVADGLHRTVVHRCVVAGAGRGDTPVRARRLRRPRAPFRADRGPEPGTRHRPGARPMTRIRLLTSLVMAPVAIAAILLLPTGWMMALAAVVLLLGLWEWLELAGVEDSLARSALLAAHLAVMVGLVWASRSGEGLSLVLFLLASFLGVVWWLASLLWLRNFDFASTPDGYSRMIKLAAGALAMIPAWTAVGYIHGGEPHGDRWLLVALFVVWGADTGAYFVGRRFGRRKLAPRVSPNKTLEGLAGGLLVGVGVGLLVAL